MIGVIEALEAGRPREALVKLLETWREVRHPRIADLIDHISDDLTASLPAVTGKKASERIDTWLAIADAADPADLGRLLAVTWPGTWQKAMPMLRRLLAWPDDPRIARALARMLEERRYESNAAESFYRPLYGRLLALGELRALEYLRASTKLAYLRDHVVKQLAELSLPQLAPDLDDMLLAIETRYRDAAPDRAGEEGLVAAILADPDNLALRSVYGDWLSERGDPRGELIALQLATESSPAATARARDLIEEHGARWVGAFDAFFEREGRRFEGGFFAGGTLRWLGRLDVDALVHEPGWRLVRTIDRCTQGDRNLLVLLDHPDSDGLREIHVDEEETAARIAGGPTRALTMLGWRTGRSAPPAELTECRSLPQLQTLAVYGHARWLADAPVVERLERLWISDASTELLEGLARRAGRLRELVVVSGGWSIHLTRANAPAPFEALHATHRAGVAHPTSLVSGLCDPLASIPAAWLCELVVEIGRAPALSAYERSQVAEQVARFPRLIRVELPWPLEAAQPAPTRTPGLRLTLDLRGPSLLDSDAIASVWRLLAELDQRYDIFHVSAGALRPLGDQPLERIRKWASNPRTRSLRFERDGQPESVLVTREMFHADLVLPDDRTASAFVAWLARLLGVAVFREGSCWLSGTRPTMDQFAPVLKACPRPPPGWLVILGEPHRRALPVAAIEALARRPELDGLFVQRTTHNVIVGIARAPAEVTLERLAAVATALGEIELVSG